MLRLPSAFQLDATVIIWHVLATGRPYEDLGADYFAHYSQAMHSLVFDARKLTRPMLFAKVVTALHYSGQRGGCHKISTRAMMRRRSRRITRTITVKRRVSRSRPGQAFL